MSGLTYVRNCRRGDQVGNASRTLYTFVSDPVIDAQNGTVTAELVIHAKKGKSRYETRTWLDAAHAAVFVRESDYEASA